MPRPPSEEEVRDALIGLGRPAVQAHFLALLLVRGEVLSADLEAALGVSREYTHRVFRDLQKENLVEAWKGPSLRRGRAMNAYRLRDPNAFLASAKRAALQDIETLERVKVPTLGEPSGKRRGLKSTPRASRGT